MVDGGPGADAAARVLADATGVPRHDVAVVLGSGWGGAADAFGRPVAEVRFGDLPGFRPPVAPGHAGVVRSYERAGRRILAVLGRTHLFEGHGPGAVVHAVRTAAAAGCRTLVLTNASGSLRDDWAPGTGVVITDHVNLTGVSPLIRGATSSTSPMPGPRGFARSPTTQTRRSPTACTRCCPARTTTHGPRRS